MKEGHGLAEHWRAAAADLGIEVVTPFGCSTSSGTALRFPVLVRGFGAPRGMLIHTRWAQLEDVKDELVRAGFGYAVMSDPREGGTYRREVMIDVLADWGWSGAPERRPAWLASVQER